MNDPVTITARKPSKASMDYDLLRKEGLQWIEALSHKVWTDYNVHDPGITILEMLGFAITDLGYRTGFPVQDILAAETSNAKNYKEQFFSAKEILTSRPVTVNDYRKLFIDTTLEDHPDIRITNAWLEKASIEYVVDWDDESIKFTLADPKHKNTPIPLNGLYKILLEISGLPEEPSERAAQQNLVYEKVKKIFHAHRNLCEDLVNIETVPEQKIMVCADIIVKPEVKTEEVYAEILFQIHQYFSPGIGRYTLEEMLAIIDEMGEPLYTVDEIFEGPFLKNGFIRTEEMEASSLRSKIFTSDLISIIMDIEGVVAVKELLLNYGGGLQQEKRFEWCIDVASSHKPVIDLDQSAFHFYKDLIPVNSHTAKAKELYLQKLKQSVAKAGSDWSFDTGSYRAVHQYESIIHHLPKIYGVSDLGLPAGASAERRAQAKQLKGYLLFFDQILANYLMQLHSIKDLFKVRQDSYVPGATPITYFSQGLKGVLDLDLLINNYAGYDQAGGALFNMQETYDEAVERKNRLLDHLISRFAERFNDYVLALYSTYGENAQASVLTDKFQFLKDYPVISANRSAGYDYCDPAKTTWDSDNVAGMERRLAGLLGMQDHRRRTLSDLKGKINPLDIQKTESGGVEEYRFRFTDPAGSKILFSGNVKYPDQVSCETALLQAIELAGSLSNYEVKPTVNGKFQFSILSPVDNSTIARRIEFFNSEQEIRIEIQKIIDLSRKLYAQEGLFVVEHILLRPEPEWQEDAEEDNEGIFLPVCVDDDCKEQCKADPYSFRITVVLNAEAPRWRDMRFREYVEKVVRLETPAHVYPKICWVDSANLKLFEEAFQKWLQAKQGGKLEGAEEKQTLKELIEVLYNKVKNVYPPGRLADCEAVDNNPIVLGRTNIGKGQGTMDNG